MKNSNKLIIFPLIISLYFLCMPKLSSSAPCCETFYCNTSNSPYYNGDVEFPFRVVGYQPESCGCQGFDLYCDDELGVVMELPNAGKFTVYTIYQHYLREIALSDPNECLPQRLLTDLDLSSTHFRGVIQSLDFHLYNCSGVDYPIDYLFEEKIDCLSGSEYTVISERRSITNITHPNCTFLKTVSVPSDFYFSYLSSYSTIDLTWNEYDECPSCVEPEPEYRTPWQSEETNDSGLAWKVVLGIVFFSTPILIILIRYRIIQCTTQRTNNTGANTTTTSAPTSGLDQITIDSYPTFILGNSGGGLSKPDHNMCPICLSEYSPQDTLKILPNCLHRFHVDCIDIWLKSQPTCPICRTSPSQNLTHLII